ncbi:unnamed protein product [Medioppia subpectinata]|uniref:Phosphatidylinositol-specific phospholipase C X domain-containing protein n=1 Tax=Medioppia subpectinata TaxID=1979941 RepID=A0A7R9KGH2_9ACAR|nr:unnamed protein product [Medioppia subpectinata]CAG2102840.1 unnamed protein product [Medioppia subpectinata]
MEKSVDAIGDMSLLELMIPGTHNSASYGRFSHKDNTLMSKYSLCQDETVFNQLVYGIRFLDLRVAYDTVNGNRSKLWIVHGPVPMKQTLDSVLLQVRRFVELAPKEVLVIDFHRFEKGFNKDEISQRLLRRHHRKVLALILKHLSAYLVPQTMGLHSTLNELIANNKRVIVGYASDQYLSNKTFVFPKARHLWPNTDDTEELVEYFNETLCDIYPNQLFSAMVQLTADKFGIIIDRYNGLRTMAHTVNPEIAKGFSADSPLGWANCANVVASDFFLSNNLIDISIKTNLNRSKRSANHTKMDSKLN